jgi:tetratricopeptide (TPR) repeat protein
LVTSAVGLRGPLTLAAILIGLLAGSAFSAREDEKEKPDEIDQAEEAWENGDRLRAVALAKKIEQRLPEGDRSVRTAVLLAKCADDAEEALERWDHVLTLQPEKSVAAQAHWNRAQASVALGLYPQAIEACALLARDYKDDFDRGRALLGKGLAELQSGEPSDALETLALAERMTSVREDAIAAELALASANYQLGNVREALRRFEKFERDHPKDERARWAAWRAVICLRLLGRESDAVEKTERIEREDPGTIEAMQAREELRMGERAPEGPAPEGTASPQPEEGKEEEAKESEKQP